MNDGPWWIVTHEWQGCQQMSNSAEWYSAATLCGTENGARVHIGLLSLGLSPRPGYVTNRNISEPIQVAPLQSHDTLQRETADLRREVEALKQELEDAADKYSYCSCCNG